MLGFYPLASAPLASLAPQSSSSVGPVIGPYTPIRISDLSDEDKYNPTWQLLMGVPKRIALAGQNLVVVVPPPNDEYGLVLDVVRNAPVPVNGSDVLQVSQDVYEAVLDIAQHIALFKEGPGQQEAANALLARAARVGGIELSLQQASQPSRSPEMQQTRTDEASLPRELSAVEVE